MDYPFYLSIVHYLSRKRYPLDSTKEIKRKIRFHAKQYMLADGKLYRRTENPSLRGVELLHEGAANDVIRAVHNEGHFGVNNTWRRLKLAYTGPGLFKKVRSFV